MDKKAKNKVIASGVMIAVIVAIVIGSNCMNCAVIRPIAKVVSTIATTLCETLATEKLAKEGPDALDGFDVSTWCKVKKNFDPILDIVLAAQKDAEKIVSEKLDEERIKPDKPVPVDETISEPEKEPEDPGSVESTPDSGP